MQGKILIRLLNRIKPKNVPGWTVSFENRPIDPIVSEHGKQINSTISAVIWYVNHKNERADGAGRVVLCLMTFTKILVLIYVSLAWPRVKNCTFPYLNVVPLDG